MNLIGRNHEKVQLGDVRQRIDFIAFVHAQRAPSQQKKGDIRAEGRGDFQQTRWRQFLLGEHQIAQERRGGVTRASAQATARRNCFFQVDFHAAADFQFAAQGIHRAIYEIFFGRFGRERLVSLDTQRNSWLA